MEKILKLDTYFYSFYTENNIPMSNSKTFSLPVIFWIKAKPQLFRKIIHCESTESTWYSLVTFVNEM